MKTEEKVIVDILNNSSLTITSDGKPLTVITKEYSLIASEIVTKVKNFDKRDVSGQFCGTCETELQLWNVKFKQWYCPQCRSYVPQYFR